MAKESYSAKEKKSWLNGLKLGYKRCGKTLPDTRRKKENDSSFDVDEFYQRALKRTASRATKSAKPAKKQHAKRTTHKQKKKPIQKPVYDYSKGFDWTSSGRIKGSYVDGRFEPD